MKPEQRQLLDLVRAWPANLVSEGDLARLEDHLADSLIGAHVLVERGVRRLVDVGAGAGFPALPLALELPRLEVEVVESRERKAAFMRAACEALDLEPRVRVHAARSEELVGELGRESADAASCRALASPPAAAELLSPFVRPGGCLVLWGTHAQAAAVANLALPELGLGAPPLCVPAPSPLRDDGALLVWEKGGPAEARFPRRPGVAVKRPLR